MWVFNNRIIIIIQYIIYENIIINGNIRRGEDKEPQSGDWELQIDNKQKRQMLHPAQAS